MKTYLDWSSYQDAGMGDAYADIPKHGGDFAKAVAVCITSRQCENKDGKGVMCPSYRVTGNANLSTGGRVRLLKVALNSDVPANVDGSGQEGEGVLENSFANPELVEAMDLCIACKGCKRECENNVDMALIKTEFLAQRNAQEKPSARTRLFGHLPRLLHRYPQAGTWVRWRNTSPWLAALGEHWFEVAAHVPLPEPVHPSQRMAPIVAGGGGEQVNSSENAKPEVVLMYDCFSRYFEPDILDAALTVLRAGGYRVVADGSVSGADEGERPLCCGRTYLAQGMVAEAKKEAKRMIQVMHAHAEAGRVIVGLEPSCLLTLRDDYPVLGLGEAANTVAKQALLFEEFLAKEITAKRFQVSFAVPEEKEGEDPSLAHGRTLVHGHCHQKAAGAMKSMRKVLKHVPGLDFSFIEAGCCGMAGSFGLEKEHASLSQEMAEAALMPALRENSEAAVVANGFSCRHQMRAHGDGRGRHLAQMLRDCLG